MQIYKLLFMSLSRGIHVHDYASLTKHFSSFPSKRRKIGIHFLVMEKILIQIIQENLLTHLIALLAKMSYTESWQDYTELIQSRRP
jgi:hypothetical protein